VQIDIVSVPAGGTSRELLQISWAEERERGRIFSVMVFCVFLERVADLSQSGTALNNISADFGSPVVGIDDKEAEGSNDDKDDEKQTWHRPPWRLRNDQIISYLDA